MKKPLVVFCAFLTLLCFAFCSFSFGEEEKQAPRKLAREEMIRGIRGYFDLYEEELLSRVPSVIKKADEEGNAVYLFKEESGEEVALEDLDEERLSSLFQKVISEATGIQQERLHKQMQEIQRLNEINIQQQMQQQQIMNQMEQMRRMQMQQQQIIEQQMQIQRQQQQQRR